MGSGGGESNESRNDLQTERQRMHVRRGRREKILWRASCGRDWMGLATDGDDDGGDGGRLGKSRAVRSPRRSESEEGMLCNYFSFVFLLVWGKEEVMKVGCSVEDGERKGVKP